MQKKFSFNMPFPEGTQGSLPRNLKLRDRAKKMRKAGYLHEVLFWKRVRNKQIHNLDFHRQQIIGNFIVDFFAPEIGLVVELDGSSHDGKTEYDKEREVYLLSLGLKVIHFTAKDVLQKLDYVVESLNSQVAAFKIPLS
jgi:very-short-patch-repair endonuclease